MEEHEIRWGRFGLDLDLWLRGWIAIQRLLLASIILIAHRGYRWLLTYLFAQEFEGIRKLLDIIEGVAIVALTAWLLTEAIRIFLPLPWGLKIVSEKRADSHGSSANL